MKLYNPWPKGKTIRSPFGWRTHPITKKRSFHRGVDVGGSFPVTAAQDGKVVHVSADWHKLTKKQQQRQSGGNVVTIQHENNLFTTYYHGAHQSALTVGQRVKTGDFIYTSGTTGLSTGNHLHFEVRTTRTGGQVDPVPYLQGSPSVAPSPSNVSGRLDAATWKAWQTALKAKGFYKGIPDGKPGPMTARAIQEWAGVKADGNIGPITRRAVQRKLGVKEDGIWGRMTISELQRRLNAGKI
jgi:hypothetical protein